MSLVIPEVLRLEEVPKPQAGSGEQRDVDLRGMVMPNTSSEELSSIHAALIAGLENGTLHPVIGKEFRLAEAAQAHRAVMEPEAFGENRARAGGK
jgi:NADPH:quinone reductase-like Zn-dependent oxidoreductase